MGGKGCKFVTVEIPKQAEKVRFVCTISLSKTEKINNSLRKDHLRLF